MPDEKTPPEKIKDVKEDEGAKNMEERRETLEILETAKEGEKVAFDHGTYIVKDGVLFHAESEEE